MHHRRQVDAAHDQVAGVGVAKVMKPEVRDAGLGHCLGERLVAGEVRLHRLGVRKDEWAILVARLALQHLPELRHDRNLPTFTILTVLQQDVAMLKVDVVPL